MFGSPPYEGARLYLEDGRDLGIARDTEAWVAWMVQVVKASLRVCRGLVAFVVEGQNVTLSKEVTSLGTDCMGDITADAYTTRCKVAKIGPLTLPSLGVEAFF